MVFCNDNGEPTEVLQQCHNPYFNRWFSAIDKPYRYEEKTDDVTILILIDGFLQFHEDITLKGYYIRHNPYFNRWFSAMQLVKIQDFSGSESQSLF